MAVFRQFKRKKNGTEEIVDVGALAKNITEDSSHRFVSDAEKQKWNGKLDSAGDIANAKVSFSQASSRVNINSEETVSTIAGKLKKWYADFKAVVWSGSYTDLINKPTLGSAASQGIANNLTTTAAGYAMDARQGPVIQQNFNQINSNLGGVKIIPEGSGAATKYYAQLGADSASKKLLGSIVKVYTITQTTNGSLNISPDFVDYANMTTDNIKIGITEGWTEHTYTSATGHSYVYAQIVSYNPATGEVIYKLYSWGNVGNYQLYGFIIVYGN